MNRSALSHQFIVFTRLRQRRSVRVMMFWLTAIATFLVVLPSKAQSPSAMDGLTPQPTLPPSMEQLPAVPQNANDFVIPQAGNNGVNNLINNQVDNQFQYNSIYQSNYQSNYQTPMGGQGRSQYWVVVNGSESQLMAVVKQVEPTAYYRAIQGKTMIQAGVFSTPANADTRARQLVFQGIPGVQVINAQTGQVFAYTPDNSGNPGNPNPQPSTPRQKSKFYFVAIPAPANDLPAIENRIRQQTGENINIIRRNQPRGWHLAIGPFRDRNQAEQWNSYVKSIGLGNARVYYGN